MQQQSCRMIAWGANTFGQLALAPIDHPLPTPCPLPPGQDQPPKLITGGANHSFFVDASGTHLFACGSNEHGQLGLPATDSSLVAVPLGPQSTATVPSALTWTSIPLPTVNGECQIRTVAAGWAHSLVVMDPPGVVFACGDNTYGQLDGSPAKHTVAGAGTWIRVPIPNAADDPVIQVAAGLRHSVALTQTGRVFVWGAARHGQCGPNYVGGVAELVLPSTLHVPVSIAAGSYHTLVATESHVYGCGLNKHGQVGIEPVGKVHKVLDVVESYRSDQAIAGVHAGWSHSVVETVSGSLFMFGRNTYHQLGVQAGDLSFSPVHIQLPAPTQNVVSGSEHTLALCTSSGSNDNRVYSWGWNEHGNCGVRISPHLDDWHSTPEQDRPSVESLHLPNIQDPTRVHIDLDSQEQVALIGGGYAHSFAVICRH